MINMNPLVITYNPAKQKVIFYNTHTAHIHNAININTTNIHAVDKETVSNSKYLMGTSVK